MKKTIDSGSKNGVLQKGVKYFHCRSDGGIYLDPGYQQRVLNLIKLNGDPEIPDSLKKFNITSGTCLSCNRQDMESYLNHIGRPGNQ